MGLPGLKTAMCWGVAVLLAGAGAGCDNPFSPLGKSDKIQGLTYIDFTATQQRWDSDPLWDGLEVTVAYHNEFSDTLSFHDKPHQVEVQFWTKEGTTLPTRGSLLTTKSFELSNPDDPIRIPIDSYKDVLTIVDNKDVVGCMVVRVFPPQEFPAAVLVAPMDCAVVFFKAETTGD